ncbi:monocarboxylate transporter 12-like isoform X2 [Babylonia areolata]|uniref:monocarboxylate transporter 12-like isoform X2 n=1 Tax=Babylonia areolata TaxID=304850 RepID=UPI003FD21CB4
MKNTDDEPLKDGGPEVNEYHSTPAAPLPGSQDCYESDLPVDIGAPSLQGSEADIMKNTDDEPLKDGGPEVNEYHSTPAAPPPESQDCYESDLPIDRGYAWVIVFAGLLSNVVCLGLQRAYGLLFVEFLHEYHMPVGLTSVILSLQSAFCSVSGLLTQTVMLSLLSERQTVMLGAVCGAAGTILGCFSSTLVHLILTQSVLVGTGNGMIMGPIIIIVGRYFQRYRSLAIAVATLGGNIGSMVMPILTEFLLQLFGLQGALLVLGATFLNILVFAGLLRPLEQNRRWRRRRATSAVDDQLLNNNDNNTSHTDKVKDTATAQRWSLCEGDSNSDSNPFQPHVKKTAWVSMPELTFATEITINHATTADDGEGKEEENDNKNCCELQPLKNGDMTEKDAVHSPQKKTSSCSKFLALFDFRLFTQPAFLLVLVTCSLGFVPAALFGMYLPAMAEDAGVTGHKSALLLTVFGGIGIFSRLAFGYMADMNCIRRVYLMALQVTVVCVVGLFTPLFIDFPLLVFFSVCYGLFGIVFFSLVPVVIVDLVGLDKMARTLGFVQLFQGVLTAVSHPVIGHLRDVTGKFYASYYFMSGLGLLCAALLLCTSLIIRQKPAPSPGPQTPVK